MKKTPTPYIFNNSGEEKPFYEGKVVLITGGTGSWGQELSRQILAQDPKEVRIVSRGEHAQVDMMRNFNDPRLSFYLGDVRDLNRMMEVMQDVDVVFHLAALKHVPVAERHIWETVQTNVMGTQNIVDAARANKVERAIYVSSDKAVEPINLYGHTKAISEKIFITANAFPKSKVVFSCIRAGNVLGTHGSVVPLFREQIAKHNKISLTDGNMTRFFVPVSNMVAFLAETASRAVGGEIFVPKMPAIKTMELAQTMITSLGNKRTKVEVIGMRPGEKIHELLISHDEAQRTVEFPDHFVILPYAFIMQEVPQLELYKKEKNGRLAEVRVYGSENAVQLTGKTVSQFLRKNGYLSALI
jgi:FlaA1/EpsC-like NDP-sugar epimerase